MNPYMCQLFTDEGEQSVFAIYSDTKLYSNPQERVNGENHVFCMTKFSEEAMHVHVKLFLGQVLNAVACMLSFGVLLSSLKIIDSAYS